jgi:hypothetical protein
MRKIMLILAAIVTVGLPAGEAGATPPSDVVFVVETSLVTSDPAPFMAFGEAVDVGVACTEGVVVDAAAKVTGFTPNGFNFHGIKHFTCGDGSGEFFVNLQARISFESGVNFNWNVLSGTGDYVDLHGAGRGIGIGGEPCGDPDVCVLDVYFGGLHID